ncbi:MAG: saccharopine dehydrogenase NADP-binding domain-containing protein [Pseudomonadales bacterium]|nr:saccharopine dehydrogenase NADP-binding domain-containing protein [Pseudomonadales bacterium]
MNPNAEFDVVVFGATGFTGQLVAEYLNKQYGKNGGITWAMAGRSADKLAEVRDLIGAPADTPLIVADSSDTASLDAMAQRAKCVLTSVGPYSLYGEPVVKACVEAGADYVDLCGEVLFMREMIEKYEAAAKQSGARLVFSCGFDSIPFDLGVQFLQEEAVKAFGQPMSRVRGRMRAMQGTLSGGTAASGAATMAAVQNDASLMAPLMDPFSLADGFQGPAQPAGNEIHEDEAIGQWVAPFMMAVINTKNIHRSNALMGHAYGEDFVYDEMMIGGSGETGKAAAEAAASNQFLSEGEAPKPGEGPSKKEQEEGYYDLMVHGTALDGNTLSVTVTGDKDPGYGSTSKMIAESAICLVKDLPEIAGGFYTPAPALGATLRNRLIASAGLTFTVDQ